MKITSEHADLIANEVAAVIRADFHRHITGLIRSSKLPDMGIRSVDALADRVSNSVIKEVFPFMDGAQLPSWMAEKKPHLKEGSN